MTNHYSDEKIQYSREKLKEFAALLFNLADDNDEELSDSCVMLWEALEPSLILLAEDD